MKTAIITFILLSGLCNYLPAQNRLFLSKTDLKTRNVKEIAINGCYNFFNDGVLVSSFSPADIENKSSVFYFSNGYLNQLKTQDYSVFFEYYDVFFAKDWAYLKKDRKPAYVRFIDGVLKRSLSNTSGPFIKGWRMDWKGGICAEYRYTKRLQSVEASICDNDDLPDSKIRYNYDIDGRLISSYINDQVSPYSTLYLYEGKQIVGFYPARPLIITHKETSSDSVYNDSKMFELISLGRQKFMDQKLAPAALPKIIEDSYYPVKSAQVKINGMELKPFLKTIHKQDARYVVMEVADNYYLFYKLID